MLTTYNYTYLFISLEVLKRVIFFRLTDTTAYVRLKEKTIDNAKSCVPATLNGSSLYSIMPYAQVPISCTIFNENFNQFLF